MCTASQGNAANQKKKRRIKVFTKMNNSKEAGHPPHVFAAAYIQHRFKETAPDLIRSI